MKYLKLYRLFESNTGNGLIQLVSINQFFDPGEGILYPVRFKIVGNALDIYGDGECDRDNPYILNDNPSGFLRTIGASEEDIEIVQSSLQSTEEHAKNKINWELIETAKDLSLSYLDDGSRLCVYVFTKDSNIGDVLCYVEIFSHNDSAKRWMSLFRNKIEVIKRCNQLEYMIRVDKGGILEPEKSKELFSLMKEYFPNEIISSI